MFDRVMDWLANEPVRHDKGFDDHDIRVCVAALFYHMIAVDGEVADVERQQLRRQLSQRYKLSEGQLEALEQEGEANDKESAGLFPYTVILNRQLDAGQRWRIFNQLKQLAMADGTIHDLEQGMLDHVKILLKLEPV